MGEGKGRGEHGGGKGERGTLGRITNGRVFTHALQLSCAQMLDKILSH